MKKFVCTVCGYVHIGKEPPVTCIQCGVGHDKFREFTDLDELTGTSDPFIWSDNHRIGAARNVDEEITLFLRASFMGAGAGVGIYMAIARQAEREGFPEIGETCRRVAMEKAEHAGKFAELLGEVLMEDTGANLKTRIEAEYNSSRSKKELSVKAKMLSHDSIHDMVHNACKDESRHGQMLEGLLRRYF